jgi:hypothetical protein
MISYGYSTQSGEVAKWAGRAIALRGWTRCDKMGASDDGLSLLWLGPPEPDPAALRFNAQDFHLDHVPDL